MRSRLLALAALFLASDASAQVETSGFDLTMHSLTVRSGIARVNLTVKNNSGRDARRVFVDCAMLDKSGKPQEIAKELLSNVRAGESVHGAASGIAFEGLKEATCRVSQVTFARF